MEKIEVEGIVIKNIDFKESSKILTILTKEKGSISCISKGCKNIKSKLRSVSGKLSYCKFYISYKKDGLSTLISADVIDPLKNIVMDISKISYASYILELTNQIMKEENSYLVFDIMISALLKINRGLSEEIITSILEVKYLSFLGIAPNLDCCSICGNTNDIITLSITDGGFVCKKCYKDGKIYNDKVIKLLRLFYYVDISKIDKLDIKKETLDEINEILNIYYDDYSGLYLNSKKFISKLNKVGL